MSLGSWAAWLALVLALPVAAAHGSPSVHEEHVRDIHYAETPARGDAMPVQVDLVNTTNLSAVRLIYCRVQHYACGPALAMRPIWTGQYEATIPWTPRFFDGVTTVGVRIEMEFQDGNVTHSPLEHYPDRPVDLPPEGDTYYYYRLPAESPSMGFVALLVLVCVVAVLRR